MNQLLRQLLPLLILPQLCLAGLGHSIVVCVSADAHLALELAACCDAPADPSDVDTADERAGDPSDDEDCGDCADLELALEGDLDRGPDGQSVLQPIGLSRTPYGADPDSGRARAAPDTWTGHPQVPPHLALLAGVRMRT